VNLPCRNLRGSPSDMMSALLPPLPKAVYRYSQWIVIGAMPLQWWAPKQVISKACRRGQSVPEERRDYLKIPVLGAQFASNNASAPGQFLQLTTHTSLHLIKRVLMVSSDGSASIQNAALTHIWARHLRSVPQACEHNASLTMTPWGQDLIIPQLFTTKFFPIFYKL
jgi:hypothetical protein